MNCSISNFSSLLTKLDTNWTSSWTTFLAEYGPLKDGLTFGSCYTSCGSIGFNGITGINNLSLETTPGPDGPTATFTTCNLEDQAVIVVPLASRPITLHGKLRASGQNVLWPTGLGSAAVDHDLSAAISGFLLITIPRKNNILYFSRPLLDIAFYINYTASAGSQNFGNFPNTDSLLFHTVPKEKLLFDFSDVLRTAAKKRLLPKIFNIIQSNDAYLDCTWPVALREACTSETVMPLAACHPCDTCCKCLIQQRCDGECSNCACVNCTPHIWRYQTAICAVLMIFVAIVLFYDIKIN